MNSPPLYQHTIYRYDDPEAARYRALFGAVRGDYIVVITGVAVTTSEYGMWVTFPDDMYTGIWDLFSFVHRATGANDERVFLLIELKARL